MKENLPPACTKANIYMMSATTNISTDHNFTNKRTIVYSTKFYNCRISMLINILRCLYGNIIIGFQGYTELEKPLNTAIIRKQKARGTFVLISRKKTQC